MRKLLLGLLSAVALSAAATAAPVMYVDDGNGVLATVDVDTGATNVIGSMGVIMTDIAFDPSGNLYGISFGALYSINRTTAAATFIGNHGVSGGNALVFASDGTLYAAGNTSSSLFTIDPTSGATTNLGNIGFASGGDLAFHGGNFYLASSNSELVLIDLGDLSNTAAVGPFGVSSVFGLATGDDGVLYGVAGTQIFTVDTTTGAATNPVDYSGQGLSQAFGQSFFTESGAPPLTPTVPVPATLALLGLGYSMLAFARRKSR